MSGNGVVKRIHGALLALPEGLLVAMIYGAACRVARQVSLDQFFLPAGVRIAALLLCPSRLLPYLLLGEFAYFAHLRIPMVERYGLEWALLSSACQFPAVAVVVHLHRRLIMRRAEASLLTIAASSALVVGVGTWAIAHALWPSPPSGGFVTVALRNVLGDYVAILTVAPLALVWLGRSRVDWQTFLDPWTTCAALSLLALGIASHLLPQDASMGRATLQLMMAAPVVALTCLKGWWGAAIGVPLMNIFIRVGTSVTGLPASFDHDAFNVQLITALSGTALLALGSKITRYFHQCSVHASARKQAISNARTSHIVGERELRNRVRDLGTIGDGLDSALRETIEWLRIRGYHDVASSLLNVATVHSRRFREQTSMVYPSAMEHVGLYLALQVGGIGDVWKESARVLPPHFAGDPCRLDLDLQLTAYRALTEAVSLLLAQERGQLKIRARCGRLGSTHGIVITVDVVDALQPLSRTTATMAVGRLSGYTQAYGGTVQCSRNRIRMAFAEPSTCYGR